jgi:dTDP-4-dehydrorhamnose 3,5-epimerase
VKVTATARPEVRVIEPDVFGDARGFLMETWNERSFREATGLDVHFVQDNHSPLRQHVPRGLRDQLANAQGKLIRVVRGALFDVAVDLGGLSQPRRRPAGIS